jgi:hypothetical protein
MRIVSWLFFATLSLVLLLQLRGLDAPLVTPDTTWGILSYEFAFTVARAQVVLDAWKAAGALEAARVSLGVDGGFLLAYPLFFWSSIRLLRRFDGTRLDRLGHTVGAAVLACIPLDALENVLLWRMIDDGPSAASAALAGVAATLKFILILAASGWCLAALTRRFAR